MFGKFSDWGILHNEVFIFDFSGNNSVGHAVMEIALMTYRNIFEVVFSVLNKELIIFTKRDYGNILFQ